MNTTLIIMAAGIGSRYGGGIKQLAKVGPSDEIILESISPHIPDIDFSAKWTVAESLMKLSGGGFGDLASLPQLMKECKTEIRTIKLNTKYYLTIAVKEN